MKQVSTINSQKGSWRQLMINAETEDVICRGVEQPDGKGRTYDEWGMKGANEGDCDDDIYSP